MSKNVVCLVCGGQSAEHEVSLQSARNVLSAMNRDRFEVLLAGIDKKGIWKYYPDEAFLDNADDPSTIKLSDNGVPVFPVLSEDAKPVLQELNSAVQHPFDLLFPVIHGTNGEDGAIQGLCRMLNVPCVGCEQAASANCMDKDLAKRLLAGAGIRVAKWIVLHKGIDRPASEQIISELGMPLFVKPARTGSSVGVTKVVNIEELDAAIEEAFKFDTKLLIEEYIVGREIECAVLGNENPRVAVPGEVIPKVEFYSYKAKYIMANGAELEAPAKLTAEQ
ncbi:MAG: D-alanine--D-alanine ligase, partial [Victivallales bacterium]|nr:D-alanine--D-alanine ligase [Victivallales bacterium]